MITTLTPDLTASTLLGQLLATFLQVLSGGMVRSLGDMLWLLRMLATMELMIAATAWYHAQGELFLKLFWKLVGIFVLMAIVDQWKWWVDHVREGFIQAGLMIGANAISLTDFTDPGNIIDFGFSVTAVVFRRIKDLSWWSQSSEILYSGFAAWCTVLFYIVMGTAVFKAMLEYYLVCAAGVFLVVFLGFEKTAFIGERVFSTIIAHATRLMLLALLLNIALPVLYRYQLPLNPQFREVMLLLGVSFILMVLALSMQALANGFVHGTPALGWHSVMHGLTSFTQTMAVLGAVGAGASYLGGRAVEGALHMGSAMREAARMGSQEYNRQHPFTHASRAGQRASTYLGGAQGLARYSTARLTHGLRQRMAAGRESAHTLMP